MSSTEHYQNYINGQFVAAASSNRIDVVNPASGELLSTIPDSNADDVNRAVAAAKTAQVEWARKPAIERAGYLRRIATKLRENVPALARTIVAEQGKVMGLAEVEVNFTADYLDYMAEWARRIEGEVITSDRPDETIFYSVNPLG
nr:aldehyde dehydrogenase family protein [Aliamphritea spongicola]